MKKQLFLALENWQSNKIPATLASLFQPEFIKMGNEISELNKNAFQRTKLVSNFISPYTEGPDTCLAWHTGHTDTCC